MIYQIILILIAIGTFTFCYYMGYVAGFKDSEMRYYEKRAKEYQKTMKELTNQRTMKN